MIALGLVHVVNCGVIYTLVSLGSKSVLRERPKGARMVGQVSGLAMIAIALLLFAEQTVCSLPAEVARPHYAMSEGCAGWAGAAPPAQGTSHAAE